MSKYLIINADDFGMSEIFNEVILDLLKKDYLSSTTVIVNRVTNIQKEQFKKLKSLSKERNISVGLHLEFLNTDYPLQIESQYQKFKKIFGSEPSHIDIHKQPIFVDSFRSVAEFCKSNNLSHRKIDVAGEKGNRSPKETFFGSISNFSKMKKWVETLEENVFYEILFHPGRFDPNCNSSLNKEREQDIKHIKNLKPLLEANNIQIVSYLDFTKFNSKS